MLMNNDVMYHIGLRPSDAAPAAIICGDPGRVEKIARMMDEPQFVASKREYTTWSAKIDGKRVLIVDDVISTGESLAAVEKLVQAAGGNIVGRMAILAEGDAQTREDLIYLNPLPLFHPDGTVMA